LLPRRGDTPDQWGIEFPLPVEQLATFAENRRGGCLQARASVLGGRLRGIPQAGAWAAILAVVVSGSASAVPSTSSAGAPPTRNEPGLVLVADSAQIASLPSIAEQPSATSSATPGPTPGATSTPTPVPTPGPTLPAEAVAIEPASNTPAPAEPEAPAVQAGSIALPTIQDARNYLVARLGTRVDRHWGRSQSQCASLIFEYESTWNPHATNRRSGAYGLPQAYPASKLANWAEAKATAAAKAGDPKAAWLYRAWRDNPVVQAEWGVDYMIERYGSPCAALAFRNQAGWY
jgi:colicin import membrane protein